MKKIICGLILLSLPVFADELKSVKSKMLAEQLVRSINQKLADITALELAAGVKQENINISLTQVSRYDSGRFGAIMDADKLGLILSVTPNSPASLLGVQSRDIILRVNDRLITDKNFNWKAQLQFAEDNTKVSILVERKSRKLLLKGILKGKYIPNWQLSSSNELRPNDKLNYPNLVNTSLASIDMPVREESGNIAENNKACGRVVAYEYFRARKGKIIPINAIDYIHRIDGDRVAGGKTRFKLTPGKHVLELMFKYGTKKKFIIHIKENITYSIGMVGDTEWLDDEKNIILPADYSGPAIIKTQAQKCEL
ncbi:MAG: PDZ domain-containing protein [Colwellia sp.]|nr:PDZ domain-containing protein [Colwellia sp.]MCW9082109.1 PDZ domain-containing protein [Colwellia sp.]